jgi:CBS domain containing-hemolysin-like protein
VSLVWIAAACLALTMFFSAAEMAFIAANRLRLRHLAQEGKGVAAGYLESFRNPGGIMATASIGITVAIVRHQSATRPS